MKIITYLSKYYKNPFKLIRDWNKSFTISKNQSKYDLQEKIGILATYLPPCGFILNCPVFLRSSFF